jgi:PAS domain S-box-containing protein
MLVDTGQPISLYSLPINTFRGCIGVLEVYTSHVKHFDDQEYTVLSTLAASAGVAISNALLLDEQVNARAQAERLAQVASEQAAQLLATFSSLSDGVWICDKQGTLVSINDAALQMFGLERDDVLGTQLSDLHKLYQVVRGERRRLGLRVALHGEHMHTECEIVVPHHAQQLIIDVRAAPVRDERGSVIGAVSVVRDITQAHAMARLKDDFLAIAAHELKTPITALKGYTQLVLKRTRSTPNVDNIRRALHTIDEQADRIAGLVQKLLDVTRIQTGNLELQRTRLDLQSLVTGVVEKAQQAASSQRFEVRAHAPILLDIDHQRIEQVLENLIDNAAKYSSSESTIVIETTTEDDYACVTVHDTGVGIPAEKLPHIFDQWYQAHFTTHGDYGGMGLGLYISKNIIDQHGGYMWAESSEDGGTTVGFAIPLHPNEIIED